MTTKRTAPASNVSLADMRQTYSQTRLRFTKAIGAPKITRKDEPVPDLITLACLISEIYRSYGDELEPVRQFHPSRETPYSKGHTSAVSHVSVLRRDATPVVSREATTTVSENIIIKRPRKSIFEQETYALISFITELRVRTHPPLREHPNIARLRGVGWDFEDEEAMIPRPLLLEELAPQGALDNFWARWSFIRLKFKSKLDLARNIAEGIRAMHDCGVVHGDIKPENILIFPRKDVDNEFVAKLTDFGHSIFEYSHSTTLPAFTPQWCAPELSQDGSSPEPMGFHEMTLTDTYSYGLVVLSIMIDRPFHQSIKDFRALKANGRMLREAIELVRREDREKDDADLDLTTIKLLLRRAIRVRPIRRNLEQCIEVMNRYDRVNGHKTLSSSHDGTSKEHIKELGIVEMVAIGHSTFSQISHQLKARIVESLLHIANDSKDPRRLVTAWELSVCYFSGFGVERSFQHSSKWLSVASEGGVAAARNYIAILHQAMNIPYDAPPMRINQHQTPSVAVIRRQPETQDIKPRSGDWVYASSESDYDSDTEGVPKPPVRVTSSKKMPSKLLDILNAKTPKDLKMYLQDNPEDLNSQDAEGNTPLMLAARRQLVGMLKFLLSQPDVDAGIPNRSGHTVLHFLPLFDDETIRYLVPQLTQRGADLQREALSMPLRSEEIVLIPEIRCCSILNATLHGNLTLLKCLLEAAHAKGTTNHCQICEAASRFRRILAVSLSIFQARALEILLAHVRDKKNLQDIGHETIRVWAGSELLPLHKVPFNSVAIRALDLPDSLFRAINYGTRYVEALEATITLLLSTEKNVEDLAYSMMIEAVESNNWEAVQFLLKEGEKRGFAKSWWIRGPLDGSPFMRSISLGFREVFRLFLQYDSSLFQRKLAVDCWLSHCYSPHAPKRWYRSVGTILSRDIRAPLLESERKHHFNPVQRALWLSIDSSHQDSFFVDTILDVADPKLMKSAQDQLVLVRGQLHTSKKPKAPVRSGMRIIVNTRGLGLPVDPGASLLDGSDFLEHAILSSVFSSAATIIDRFPDVLQTRSRWYLPRVRRLQKLNNRNTSKLSILQVLRRGSYRQCRFVMERLSLLRAYRTSSVTENGPFSREEFKTEEEGVQQWTRCPLSREEYHQLVLGNIETNGSARGDLWNVVETQAKLGHSRSVSYLKLAILYGNIEALEEMLRRGWDPNGPFWARLSTPLQYAASLRTMLRTMTRRFKTFCIIADLPQADWSYERSHTFVYKAYRQWLEDYHQNEWKTRLEMSQEILRKYGGKALPLVAKLSRVWALIAFALAYGLLLPLTFTYATERTWTSISRGQKLGFSYLWSVMSALFSPIQLMHDDRYLNVPTIWMLNVLLIIINHIIIPILIMHVNWRPFLFCYYTTIDSEADAGCDTSIKCTDYSYLLPLVVGGIEALLWNLVNSTKSYHQRYDPLLGIMRHLKYIFRWQF